MTDAYEYPRLRWPIDLKIELLDDRKVLLLRDPVGITTNPLVLVAEVAPLISMFDGRCSVADLVKRLKHLGVNLQLVKDLISLLDQNLFLHSPRFIEAERMARQSFASASHRKAALAGGAYSANAIELRQEIDSYLKPHNFKKITQHGALSALITPHIDYARGHQCYGASYASLSAEQHDLYILLGTAHQYSPYLFHLTKKTFETPLGELASDNIFVNTLARLYGYERSFADEILHKNEHSLELQIPFLTRINDTKPVSLRTKPKIVPILVGSFHNFLEKSEYPNAWPEYDEFIEALVECIKQESNRRICFIAGVDMSHIGRAFGDKDPLSKEFLDYIRQEDQAYIDAILLQNKELLWANIQKDNNARRVCGYSSLYTLLDLFERLGKSYSSELIEYRQAVDLNRDCAVTFAGLAMYEQIKS